jgi:nitrite reductase (NADH) large subunit
MAAVAALPVDAEICGCDGVCKSKITGADKGSVRMIPAQARRRASFSRARRARKSGRVK